MGKRDIDSQKSLPSMLKAQHKKRKGGRERGTKEGGQGGGWEEGKGAGVNRGKNIIG